MKQSLKKIFLCHRCGEKGFKENAYVSWGKENKGEWFVKVITVCPKCLKEIKKIIGNIKDASRKEEQ